ncbi:MAG: D-alanyl-D-alanine carboxypeptidase family protein, partial [Oscillospiraceae bacterium]
GLSDCYTAAFANREELPLDASAVVLVERETGEVLYEKNADEPRAIASITKVMTIILVMEALESGKISLDETVNISEHAFSMGGSQIWLEPGEIFTVNELLKAVSVASANDAAVALAEHVGGSEDGFVSMMNQKAAELGMTKTTFKNSNGLDEDGHISCARDVALMSREILKHELVRNYITTWMDELRNGETQLTNTNKMLKSFNGISGIKTGTTNKAGVCISASAIRNDMELIAVVLGSSDSKARFASAGTLLEYGFANYELAPIKLDMALLTPVEVSLGEEEKCGIV